MVANLTTRLGQLVDVLTPDTTNTRIGVANASPTRTLDVTGTGAISTSLAIGGATIGTNALAVTGSSLFPGSTTITAAGLVGIGMAPVNVLDITLTQNAASTAKILNSNASTAAQAQFVASNGTGSLNMTMLGTGYTTSGALASGRGVIYSTSTAGLCLMASDVSGPLVFSAGGTTEKARIGTDGSFLVGGTTNVGAGVGYFANQLWVGSTSNSGTWTGINFNKNSGQAFIELSTNASSATIQYFEYNGTTVGTIALVGTTAIVYNTTSDETLKNFDVKQRDFRAMIEDIMVQDAEFLAEPGSTFLSISAQQTAKAGYWDAVTPPDQKKKDASWQAEYSRLGILALWGVKDLYAENEALKARVATLEARLTALETK